MEPNLPSVGPNFESAPKPEQTAGAEYGQNAPEVQRAPEVKPEQWENRGVEQAGSAAQLAQPTVPLPAIPPQPTPTDVVTKTTNDPTALPLVAADEDLIEKEWVNKAKAVIAATRNDPNEQKNEVDKLKADYLMKRYNKDLKAPQE